MDNVKVASDLVKLAKSLVGNKDLDKEYGQVGVSLVDMMKTINRDNDLTKEQKKKLNNLVQDVIDSHDKLGDLIEDIREEMDK